MTKRKGAAGQRLHGEESGGDREEVRAEGVARG